MMGPPGTRTGSWGTSMTVRVNAPSWTSPTTRFWCLAAPSSTTRSVPRPARRGSASAQLSQTVYKQPGGHDTSQMRPALFAAEIRSCQRCAKAGTSAMVSMPGVTDSSEGRSVSPHRENLRPVSGQFERTTHLEPVTFVQCDVRRVAGLQICRHPGLVDPAQVLRQQVEPISSSPVLGSRAQQTQVEVRHFSGVCPVKQLERVKHRRSIRAQHLDDGRLECCFLLLR